MLIVNRHNSKVLHTAHGSEIRPLIDRTTSPITQCSLAEEILPPGATVTPHHHEVLEEIYYILEGRGIMRIDDEEQPVGAGDGVHQALVSRHERLPGPAVAFEAAGNQSLVLEWIQLRHEGNGSHGGNSMPRPAAAGIKEAPVDTCSSDSPRHPPARKKVRRRLIGGRLEGRRDEG